MNAKRVKFTDEARHGIPAGVKLTPMMAQYIAAKAQYPEALLFFRMGDFYEMFFEDAELGGRYLDLNITSRDKKSSVPAPMSGFPHHQLSNYLAKALAAGLKVAVCDQLTDPKQSRGIVERGITQVVTPGVVLDAQSLEARAHNFLVALLRQGEGEEASYALAALDISTGSFRATEVIGPGALRCELSRLEPRELLLPPDLELPEAQERLKEISLSRLDLFQPSERFLERLLGPKGEPVQQAVERFGFGNPEAILSAVSAVMAYILETQKSLPEHSRVLEPYRAHDTLILDETAKRNLELFRTLLEGRKRGALLGVLDQAVTAMGGRRLRHWLAYPLMDPTAINLRLDAVEALKENTEHRQQLRGLLKGVYDLERLNARLATLRAGPRDLWFLRLSLEALPALRSLSASLPALESLTRRLKDLGEVVDLLASTLNDDPPSQLKDGGVIRLGFHPELDRLVTLSTNAKDWLLKLEARERETTGIGSLKLKFNRVFGYFIEVSKANIRLVPERYIRKQTLTNSERYFTPELKEFEEEVLNAESRRLLLEANLYQALREALVPHVEEIAETAKALADLDALGALAELAQQNDYCRPVVDGGDLIEIIEGRHPVVEQAVGREAFVPNSLRLDREQQSLIILTGPNMAGKSTVMRQVALISLMAQMGGFVPAKSARLGVVDRIFTRVGAVDDLAAGRSTFMVEMHETATILKEATGRSLLILDEIGRGTSTFDGVSIAWSVAEHVHDILGARTLFATHYHELTELAEIKPRVANFTIAVKEWKDEVVFLRQLIPGGANRSYGIQVGRLAGLPVGVVDRAKEVLIALQGSKEEELHGAQIIGGEQLKMPEHNLQMSLFSPPPIPAAPSPVERELRAADLNSLSPIQALNFLHSLRGRLS